MAIDAETVFGSVEMIVKLWSQPPSGVFHASHRTCNAKDLIVAYGKPERLFTHPERRAKAAAWMLRAEYRSPRWTTRWEDLPRVRALLKLKAV